MERSRAEHDGAGQGTLAIAPHQAAAYNGVLFWPVLVVVLVADLVTKAIAAYALGPVGFAHEVLGEYLRFTLVYNPGAAFGLHLGPWSRWIFLALAAGVLVVLWRLFRETRAGDNPRTLALALVCAGAVGNALDRLRSADGVVDFIDVGVGAMRWPTFNVADVAVTGGAALLAWVLWREESAMAEAADRSVMPAATPEAP
jgi:signal peptidase II